MNEDTLSHSEIILIQVPTTDPLVQTAPEGQKRGNNNRGSPRKNSEQAPHREGTRRGKFLTWPWASLREP